jgi:hypothetical protein
MEKNGAVVLGLFSKGELAIWLFPGIRMKNLEIPTTPTAKRQGWRLAELGQLRK